MHTGSAGVGSTGGSSGSAAGTGAGGGAATLPPLDGQTYPQPPGVGTGKEYHVAQTGSDQNNGASAASAFRTLQHAVDVVRPGDVILVHDGQFDGFVVRAAQFGSDTAWIVMRAFEQAQPVVRGPGAGPPVYFSAASCDESNDLV